MTVRAKFRTAVPILAGALLVLVLACAGTVHTARAGTEPVIRDICGMPVGSLAWIDYGEGSVKPDVRAVLARPGVIVSSSGTGVPADFRKKGAATTYWVLHLNRLIGEPATPADPASIPGVAAELLADAQASSACATPWIALNEMLGSGAKAPWSPTTTQYRADLLALVQQLAAGGAHPAVLIHGDPTVAGETATWWRQLAASATLVYEAYYDAPHIYAMGPVMGNRRMRLGIDNVVKLYESAGIQSERLGVMLGFHSAQTPGIAGRQGLQPLDAWARVIKWEALTAKEAAQRHHLSTVWSWGWGTFGPESVDPDKAAAACVYLWARDATLCNAPSVVGPALNTSLVEGQIVIPPGAACTFAGGGRVWQAEVNRLARLTGSPQQALTALFARAAMSRVASVTSKQVLAFEQAVIRRSFGGSMKAYVKALAQRHATVAVARGVIGDELRRRAIASMLAETDPAQTTFAATIARESQLVDTAICANDVLPGTGNFPASDARDIGVVSLPARLPFLFKDRTPPAAPAPPTAVPGPKGVALTWASGSETDLAGYEVYASVAGGALTKLSSALVPRLDFVAPVVPAGQTAAYVVRAVDTSGNRSAASPAVTVTTG
jgi:hypothetical protein